MPAHLISRSLAPVTFNAMPSRAGPSSHRRISTFPEPPLDDYEHLDLEDALYADSPSCSLEESLQRSIRLRQERQVGTEIAEALTRLGGDVQLMPSRDLVAAVTEAVLDQACSEPYGHFGCRVDFIVEQDSPVQGDAAKTQLSLGSLTFQEHMVTTHVIRVILQEDLRRRLFSLQFYAAKLRPNSVRRPIFLSDHCTVSKQRLYR